MKTVKSIVTVVMLVIAAAIMFAGCGKTEDTDITGSDTSAALPADLFLKEAPGEIKSVSELKKSAQEGDAVAVKVIVGGRKDAFVSGKAAMTVIDASVVNPCLKEDDHCKTPWDYCCTPMNEKMEQMATVQVAGKDGRPLSGSLMTGAMKELSTIIVRGTVAPRPDEKILIINATGIYVE